jgi:hypothetical protein
MSAELIIFLLHILECNLGERTSAIHGRDGLGCTVAAVPSSLDLLLHLNFYWSSFTCESALQPITSKTRAHRGGSEIVTREPNLPDLRYLPLSSETVTEDEEDRMNLTLAPLLWKAQ